MTRKALALALGALLVLATAGPALADTTGYEGQPGNQSNGGSGQNGDGLLGYEGQPGNQGDGGGSGQTGPAPGLLGYEGQPGNQGG